MTGLTAQEQTELARRQKGRLLGIAGFAVVMAVVIYAVALVRL